MTHIVGVRAFGSQLLCEQVAGRALRRRQYFVDPKTGKFPPEYAHIIGVPFKFFKGGSSELPPPQDIKLLRALPERSALEIRFPQLNGYKVEAALAELRADFSGTPGFAIDFTRMPVQTALGTAFSADREQLRADPDSLRDQEVVYWNASQVLSRYYRDEGGRPELTRFGGLRRIAQQWYDEAAATDAVIEGAAQIVPLVNRYNPAGSTGHVHAATTKPVFATSKSHVNLVVADTDSWEQIAAKTLEQLDAVESYVKNAFLGFDVPYVDKTGAERRYLPDFICRVRTPGGERFNLIVEITGFAKDKAEKRWFMLNRWLPAVNGQRDKLGLLPWHFVEVTDIERIKNQLTAEIDRIGNEVDAARVVA